MQLLWWYSDAISSLTLCCVNLKRKLVVLFIVEADGSFDVLIAHVKCLAEPPIPLMSCSLSDYVEGSIIFRSQLVLDPDSLSSGYVHNNMFSFEKDEMSILAPF